MKRIIYLLIMVTIYSSCSQLVLQHEQSHSKELILIKNDFILSKFEVKDMNDSLNIDFLLKNRRISQIYVDTSQYLFKSQAYIKGEQDTLNKLLVSLGKQTDLNPEPVNIIGLRREKLNFNIKVSKDVDVITFRIFYVKKQKSIEAYNQFHRQYQIPNDTYYDDIFLAHGEYVEFHVYIKEEKLKASLAEVNQ